MSTYMMAAGAEMPIGYIFEFDATGLTGAPDLSTAAKVREYFGYGTWEAYGAGRVTVGAGSGYAVGSEGGEATHTLTTEEMPKHEHMANYTWSESGTQKEPLWAIKMMAEVGDGIGTWPTADVGFSGGSQPHNNLQPYRTVYRWRRIA